MSRRVLLTGASGLVGAAVLEHGLANTDWQFVCPISLRHEGISERVAQVLGHTDRDKGDPDPRKVDWPGRVELIHHDLVAPFSEVAIARMGRVDYIWNVASESHVDRSITDPRPFVENNVRLALTMADLCRRLGPDLFLQMGTDEQFGPAPLGYSHREDERFMPSNPYSASKACQSSILFSYWRTYGIPLITTQTMNIICEMQGPEKFTPMVMWKILRGETVGIHASPEGVIGSRHWLHGRNLADAWLWITQNLTPVQYPDAVEPISLNIVGDERSNLELAQMIADAMGAELKYELVNFHHSRPGHDLRYSLDGSRIAELGWKAPVPLEDSLRKTVEWTLARPEWLHL